MDVVYALGVCAALKYQYVQCTDGCSNAFSGINGMTFAMVLWRSR